MPKQQFDAKGREMHNIPIPFPVNLGDVIIVDRPDLGLQILVERVSPGTIKREERPAFAACAPVAGNNVHAVRIGNAAVLARRSTLTLCGENGTRKVKSGPRLDIPLDSITCRSCRAGLRALGFKLPDPPTTSQENEER